MKKPDGLALLKKQIAAKEIGPLYIFHGEESFLKEHYVKSIQKLLLPEGLDSFNLHRLEGKGLSFEALRDAVESAPLMCEQKLVVVTDFDLFKAGVEMKKSLEAFLTELPENNCLIFYYDILEYKPDGRQNIARVLNKQAVVVDFPVQENHQLVPWLQRHFTALGKKIEQRNAEYMIFRCGGLMTGLKTELEKVAAYSKTEFVSQSDIDAVVIPVLEAKAFEMADAVAGGKIKKAAHILQDLILMREEPIVLLGALGYQLRAIYVARLALEKRKDEKTVMEVLGLKSAYPARLAMEAAKKRPLAWCRRAVALCAEADVRLKSLGRDRERELELLLAELA